MANRPSTKQELVCRILQNGRQVKNFRTTFGETKHLFLNNVSGDPLGVTLYPLSRPISVVNATKNGTYIEIDHPWDGFLMSGGEMIKITGYRDLGKSFRFTPGDIASLGWNDLRILIKVEQSTSKTQFSLPKISTLKPKYRTPLAEMLFPSSEFKKSFLYGLIAACFVFVGIVIVLNTNETRRPSSFEELPLDYIGPFISSDHITTAPEALQKNFNSENPIAAIVPFYRSMTKTLLGVEHKYDTEISQSFLSALKQERQVFGKEFEEAEDKKLLEEERVLASRGTAMISLPVIKKASQREIILALIERIYKMHDGFRYSQSQKNLVIDEFQKQTGYEWDKYKREAIGSRKDKNLLTMMSGGFQEKLGIENVYDVSENIGSTVKQMQDYYLSQLDENADLNQTTLNTIYIGMTGNHLNFTKSLENISLNEKSGSIIASLFGSSPIRRTEEPLIGKINEGRVLNIISAKKFEVQLCYESALRRNQSLKGAMAWQWRIDTRGKTSDIELVQSEIPDNRFIRCVRKKLAGWKFPAAEIGSVQIYHEFKFKPIGG